ncbi:hypothetical protein [Endozoicomonas acroporae]|uniref:hypothetical protein n=1 Tax=Endozoicomonas acroporae TaxID=1701104 RepID=UPI003D7A1F4F
MSLNALTTLNNELSDTDRFSGTVSATLLLSWDKPGGLILKGNAEGRSGQLLWSGLSAQWQQWHLNNLQFHGNDPAQSTAELAISGLDLRVPETLAGKKDRKQPAGCIHPFIKSPDNGFVR